MLNFGCGDQLFVVKELKKKTYTVKTHVRLVDAFLGHQGK